MSGADPSAGRSLRSVWVINPAGSKLPHFASFPERLVEPCIKAGTSQRGCCPECGSPWERVVEREFVPMTDRRPEKLARGSGQKGVDGSRGDSDTPRGYSKSTTTGWRPTCDCNAGEPVPCTVADFFAGTGTVLKVAIKLGRRGIGVDLSQDYCEMAAAELDKPLQVRML